MGQQWILKSKYRRQQRHIIKHNKYYELVAVGINRSNINRLRPGVATWLLNV